MAMEPDRLAAHEAKEPEIDIAVLRKDLAFVMHYLATSVTLPGGNPELKLQAAALFLDYWKVRTGSAS